MKFLPFLLILFTFPSLASRMTTRIHSIDHELILFENGQVGFMPSGEKSLTNSLRTNEWLDVELDKNNNFLGASVVAAPKNFAPPEPEPTSTNASFDPTNLSSLEQATSIFKLMNKNHQQESQCYNRAHVWAYEEFKRSGLRSIKLFMYFTRSYIRAYRFKWWFHVTPLTYVNGAALTLDRTYMNGPVGIKTWTDNFIYSKRACPIISKYSQYRNNQETEHCYLQPASMYYWQPRDLENNERSGYTKTNWIKSEVDWSYTEAF